MPENNNINTDWDNYQPDLTAEHSRHQQRLEPLISLYQDGETDEEETATVEQYLSACAECRAYNNSVVTLNENLASYMEAIPAPRFDRRRYAFLDEGPATSTTSAGRSTGRATGSGLRIVPGSGLPDDRGRPVQPRRTGFAYNLAGGMAAALLVGLVAVFLLLVMQQVNQSKNDNANTAVAMAAQTQAVQSQSATTGTSPTPATTTPAVTEPPVTATPAPTSQANPTEAVVTPNASVNPSGPTVAPVTGNAIQKTQASVTQKPVPTSTPIPVPTNTPTASRTTAAAPQPTATPTPQPTTVAPTTAPVETATPEVTTPPAETVAPTIEATTPPATTEAPPTATPVPPTPGETSASAPGWIAYVDQSDGQIHLVKADGKNDQVISDPTVNRNIDYEKLVWSNNGKMLVAVGLNVNNGSRSIFFLDIFSPLRVEELALGFAPTFSPDNESIAFLSGPVTTKNGVLSGKPAVYSLRKRTVTTISQTNDTFAPQWFGDSTRLLIGQNQVYSLDTATSSTFKLPFTNTCLAASLSPRGDKLANLELQNDGSYQTVIYDLSSGNLDPKKPLAKASSDFQGKIGINCGAQRVNWTPDSRNIYYYVNNDGVAATCVVQANGGGSRCLTNVYDPSFNSDGSALVDISLTSSGDGQVYTANSNISTRPPKPRLIAESIVSPVWQPL